MLARQKPSNGKYRDMKMLSVEGWSSLCYEVQFKHYIDLVIALLFRQRPGFEWNRSFQRTKYKGKSMYERERREREIGRETE